MNSCIALTLAVTIALVFGFATLAAAEEATKPAVDSSAADARVMWTFKTGAPVWSSPTLVDDVIYIGSDDKNVYALDAATGGRKWAAQTGGIVRCRPAVAEGTVYFSSDDGFLCAVDSSTGAQKWRFDTGGGDVKRILPDAVGTAWDYMQSSPAVSGGVVCVGSANGNVYAVDAKDGKEKWHFKTGDIVRSSPRVAKGVVYVGSNDGFLYALDAAAGTLVWRVDTHGAEWKAVTPSPIIADGTVYCGSRNPFFYAFDAATGKEKWRFSFGASWVESSAAFDDGVIYVGSSDADKVFAIDAATGAKRWEYKAKGATWSSPAVWGDLVYIGDVDYYGLVPPGKTVKGDLLALDKDTGAEVWRMTTGEAPGIGGVFSSPVVSGGVVYFGALDGVVYAVRAK